MVKFSLFNIYVLILFIYLFLISPKSHHTTQVLVRVNLKSGFLGVLWICGAGMRKV